ncbi:tetratricopeptide repeat protein [Bryobacter aggregatus]|uniref:tetratricopeptide repeat protein n=1 Tax=Bryobacter aggregatus TaxID=360054 RepID=UPI00068ABF71|nr:tetratricopeptide repeat protein [Bryobacter aggregatus]
MKVSLIGLLTMSALLAQAPMPKVKMLSAVKPTYDTSKAARCWDLRKQRKVVESTQCFVGLLAEKEAAIQAEGLWGTGKYEDALREFDLAREVHPQDAEVRIREGALFFERFNEPEAIKSVSEALEMDAANVRGLMLMAKILSKRFDTKAVELAQRAAAADPKLYQAHELLAQLALENSEPVKAAEEAQKALAINAKALNAMATLGTIELLQNRPTDQIEKVLAIDPSYGEAWYWVGHHFVLNRRYEEAIAYYKKAVALTPDLWVAREQLGINLMRTGKPEPARVELETAYNAGFTSTEVVNSLRLMDKYSKFISTKFEGGELRLDQKESAILQPYFEQEVRKARLSFEAKYKMHLDAPLEVEVYPNHEDFAVRTMGMPGLGATGVSFGPVVAMDSPSARKAGEYHWASTLWHELSHSYILVATKFLTPRWYTEGISVHEETMVSPEWGDPPDPGTLLALKEKKFLPIAELDRGFVRPKEPNQVQLSYFQAGQAIDWIVLTYGQDRLNAMTKGFSEHKTTVEVIAEQLKLKPEEFDEKLYAFMNERYGKAASKMKEIREAMAAASKALTAKDYDTAIAEGKKATDGYPVTAMLPVGYELLSKAYLAKKDKAKAREVLREYAKAAGRNPETLKQLAQLEEEGGDKAMAAAALQRLMYISPVGDEDLHRKLGEYYLDLQQPQRALPAFQAQLASKPVDPAGAYYNLARSYLALSRRPEAKEALFQSLELAPSFKPAQKLLLELESRSSNQ